jgi:protoheme IX farnesyltransferase
VLVGWSAVTNSVTISALVLFAVIFFWTPPHFWALAIKYKDDYARADVPMLPSVATYRRTTNQILVYTVIVWALTLVFGVTAELGALYWVSAIVLGAVFTAMAVDLRRTESPARAIRMFTFSITYITLLFGAMAADVIIRNGW